MLNLGNEGIINSGLVLNYKNYSNRLSRDQRKRDLCKKPLVYCITGQYSVFGMADGVSKPRNRPLNVAKRSVQYVLLEQLGQGAFGVVHKAVEKHNTKKLVAIKRMRSTQNTAREGMGISQDAYREIKILKEISRFPHENIVRLERVFLGKPSEGGQLNLVYSYAEHDLAEIIRIHRTGRGNFPKKTIKSIIWQILKGLAFLHENWIIHRDLKPANILIKDFCEPNMQGVVQIADFGLARIFQDPLRPLSDDGDVVTIWYRAPELLLGSKHYTQAIDIWSVGCIFGELITRQALFMGKDAPKGQFQFDQMEKIIHCLGKPTPKDWADIVHCPFYDTLKNWDIPEVPSSKFSDLLSSCMATKQSNMYDLLMRMLCYDPVKRITAEQALEHPYFKEIPIPDRNCFLNDLNQRVPYPSRQQQQQQLAAAAAAAAASSTQHARGVKRPNAQIPAHESQTKRPNNSRHP